MYFIWYLLIGLAAGWIANLIVKGSGSGLIINLIVGLIGGMLGGWLLSLIGWIPVGTLGSLASAVIGAIFLLWIASLVTRGRHKNSSKNMDKSRNRPTRPISKPSPSSPPASTAGPVAAASRPLAGPFRKRMRPNPRQPSGSGRQTKSQSTVKIDGNGRRNRLTEPPDREFVGCGSAV